MTKALIPLAEGFEEIEAVTIIDVFRRAGWEVTAASLGAAMVKAANGVRIMSDSAWHETTMESFDVLVLPGGATGTATMCADESVLQAVRAFDKNKRIVGAICAAPLVLQAAGILKNRKVTGYPSIISTLTVPETSESRVVVDGNIITSRAPGTALEFALVIVSQVDGKEKAATLADAMLASMP